MIVDGRMVSISNWQVWRHEFDSGRIQNFFSGRIKIFQQYILN